MRWSILLLLLIGSCSAPAVIESGQIRMKPLYELHPKPERILLFHTFDVAGHEYRKNKETLFMGFLDSILVSAAKEINNRTGTNTEIVRGLTQLPGERDSSVFALLLRHKASHAIVIDSFNVYFDRTEVEVSRSSSGGKSREAYYDIVSDIGFLLYDKESLLKEKLMSERRTHSSRPVVSGLLAAGPNVVAQRKDAWKLTKINLDNYLDLFFERK